MLIIHTQKWNELQYPFTRKVIPNRIQDIQDGKAYIRSLQDMEAFWQFQSILDWSYALMVCGYLNPLAKHSGQSCLQLQVCLQRFEWMPRMSFSLVYGKAQSNHLWQQSLLQCSIRSVNSRTRGFLCTFDGPKTVKACLLVAVFDLQAKAMATNFVQFNGYYGCTCCLDSGEHISHRHLFLPGEEQWATHSSSHSRMCKISRRQWYFSIWGEREIKAVTSYQHCQIYTCTNWLHASSSWGCCKVFIKILARWKTPSLMSVLFGWC